MNVFNKVLTKSKTEWIVSMVNSQKFHIHSIKIIKAYYNIFNACGVFKDYIKSWNRCPANEHTWVNFKNHFREAQNELQETNELTLQEAGNAGTANLLVDEIVQRTDHEIINELAHCANLTTETPTPDPKTFKAHFISCLCTTHPDFPAKEWDRLLPQTELTLNLLRQSRYNPKLVSAYASLQGVFDFNVTPLAPARTNENPNNHSTWLPRGTNASYIGPALEHYRCVTCFVPATQALRITNTIEYFPHNAPFSKMHFIKQPLTSFPSFAIPLLLCLSSLLVTLWPLLPSARLLPSSTVLYLCLLLHLHQPCPPVPRIPVLNRHRLLHQLFPPPEAPSLLPKSHIESPSESFVSTPKDTSTTFPTPKPTFHDRHPVRPRLLVHPHSGHCFHFMCGQLWC